MPPTSDSSVEVLPYSSVSSEAVIAKVMVRLIPFMILLYLMNYLDRVNISFAKLQMMRDLKFDDASYGFGASIFFVGYLLFEVPSNLIMERVGARRWMARIMVSWGIISICMMFVRGPKSFYALRLALGFAEAGFFPGMILYLTYWIPAAQRSRAAAWFLTSTALAGVVGSPLAYVFLRFTAHALHGWQWLFLIEGIPTVLLGLAVFFLLPDGPQSARFLSIEERTWLIEHIRNDAGPSHGHHHLLSHAVASPRVWVLGTIYGAIMFGFYGINYWAPSIIQKVSGFSDSKTALFNTIPFTCAVIGMVIIGRFADQSGDRRKVVMLSSLVGAIGLFLCPLIHSTPWVIASLSVAAIGIWSTLGPFWALPSTFLRGTAAAAGIALINSMGNFFGGFVGSNMMGHIRTHFNSYNIGLFISAGVLLIATAISFQMSRDTVEPPATS